MCGSDTFATLVSSTSMNVAIVTTMATVHGLCRGRHGGCASAARASAIARDSYGLPAGGGTSNVGGTRARADVAAAGSDVAVFGRAGIADDVGPDGDVAPVNAMSTVAPA